jgi:hypothetical protein
VGLAWVIASGKNGSDLAVYGLPGKGDVLVYPANFVAKRWERREKNFLNLRTISASLLENWDNCGATQTSKREAEIVRERSFATTAEAN